MRAPAAIKSAFRRLAKKLHPDANKQDKKAATKFAELNAAYEILGDEDKRKAFDRGEIDAEGKPRFQGFEGFGAGRGRGPGRLRPGWPVRDLHLGAGRLPARRRRAGGAARRRRHRRHPEGHVRRRAAGAGRRPQFEAGGFRRRRPAAATSPARSPSRCRRPPSGTSRRVQLPTGKEIEVKIPAGLADGQTIRLKGQGLAGPRRRRGRRADHGHRSRRIRCSSATAPICGSNCRSRSTRRCSAARCACRRSTARSSSRFRPAPAAGRTFRLKGKGLPRKDGAGDLYATVRIVLPERGDAELEELMRKWRDGKPYDPRRDMS